MDCSLPGSSIHGIFQARVLEWGAIAFSNYNVEVYVNWEHISKATIPAIFTLKFQMTFEGNKFFLFIKGEHEKYMKIINII